MSTLGVFSTLKGYREYSGGVQYTGGISRVYVHWGILVQIRKATIKFQGFLFSHLLQLCSCICWPLEHQTAF